jgi:hypothetical protein
MIHIKRTERHYPSTIVNARHPSVQQPIARLQAQAAGAAGVTYYLFLEMKPASWSFLE